MRGATEEQWFGLFTLILIWGFVLVQAIRLAWMKYHDRHNI